MGKLTIEEKAQAYDEALERAKKNYDVAQDLCSGSQVGVECFKNTLANIFPELKESREEKIRKLLIRLFTSNANEKFDDASTQEIIAWLEKQAPIDEERIVKGVRRGVAMSLMEYIDANTKGMCLSNMECEDIENAVINEDWGKVYRYMKKKVEKQDEQNVPPVDEHAWLSLVSDVLTWKDGIGQYLDNPRVQKLAKKLASEYAQKLYTNQEPVDKNEPKFHEGDWIITNNKKYIYQVVKVKRGIYVVRDNADNREYHVSIESADRDGRLWTIQDANDGDVLAGKIDGDSYILIFKQVKDGWVETYGHYCDSVDRFCVPSQLFCRDYQGTFIPANKDQRDSLRIAMTDAGYMFNFEKKELKKL